MGIEASIQELTAAVRELVSHLKSTPAVAPAAKAAPVVQAAAAPKAVEEKKPAAAAPEAKTEQPKSTDAGSTPPSEVTYDQVKAAILKVVTSKGNEAATQVLKQFGVAKGPALKPEQFGAVIAACEAL